MVKSGFLYGLLESAMDCSVEISSKLINKLLQRIFSFILLLFCNKKYSKDSSHAAK